MKKRGKKRDLKTNIRNIVISIFERKGNNTCKGRRGRNYDG